MYVLQVLPSIVIVLVLLSYPIMSSSLPSSVIFVFFLVVISVWCPCIEHGSRPFIQLLAPSAFLIVGAISPTANFAQSVFFKICIQAFFKLVAKVLHLLFVRLA